jgi:soluble lytic murein transglycosylase-like protein
VCTKVAAVCLVTGWFLVCAAGAQAAECRAAAFSGARALLGRVPVEERLADARGDAPSAGWVAFQRVATAVLGPGSSRSADGGVERFIAALDAGDAATIPCDRAMVERDQMARELAMVGYSATDIASLLYREATRREIDERYARRMAGLPPAPPKQKPVPKLAAGPEDAFEITVGMPVDLAPYVRQYCREYHIDHRLVSAVISRESGWKQSSLSGKGAIGLMQLMPATASMLRVNPHDPIDNLKGGIAYLADLLRTYGNARDALIAYNAGPTHANQVLRGERPLFAETRRYVEAIGALYPLN